MSLKALVKKKGLVTQTEAASFVAGESIRGSWWTHPRGKEIFRALTELEDDEDVRSCKLIDGKVTFVHRRLWPALLRVAQERDLFPKPSAAAKAALKRLGGKLDRKVREELERTLLVIGRSEHTPTGKHEVRVEAFTDAFPADARREARRMSLEEATSALRAAGWKP